MFSQTTWAAKWDEKFVSKSSSSLTPQLDFFQKSNDMNKLVKVLSSINPLQYFNLFHRDVTYERAP